MRNKIITAAFLVLLTKYNVVSFYYMFSEYLLYVLILYDSGKSKANVEATASAEKEKQCIFELPVSRNSKVNIL